jgi:tRNA modification GTPase
VAGQIVSSQTVSLQTVSAPDTIVAIATAPGRGAVGVIRVSGPQTPEVARRLLGELPTPRKATLAQFRDADGAALDQGLALYFPAPASFTGEHVLELQGHGGPLVLDLLFQRLLHLGCRAARAGEFSERAFLNGKLDIAQAEAIADLINASTAAGARAAVRSMQGEFSALVNALQAQITELRAYVEAAIDFPDEELDFLPTAALGARLDKIFTAFEAISAAARQGTLLREGINVVLAGKPNAGKSSLLNRLAGEEVAIVTAVPGTTRDLLRRQIQLDGLPVNLVDTAGLRPTQDAIEAEGVRRAQAEIARADHVLYLLDASTESAGLIAAQMQLHLPPGIPFTVVWTKIDLISDRGLRHHPQGTAQLDLSAITGEGLDELRQHLKTVAGYQPNEGGAFTARRRHVDALTRARAAVQAAADVLQSSRAFELFAEDLRMAQLHLSEITGEFTSDDLLGEIFGSFCIGK